MNNEEYVKKIEQYKAHFTGEIKEGVAAVFEKGSEGNVSS